MQEHEIEITLACLVAFVVFFGITGKTEIANAQQSLNSPQSIIKNYCSKWVDGDVSGMYAILSRKMKKKITLEEFSERKYTEFDKIGQPYKCSIEDNIVDNGSKSLWSIRVYYENVNINSLLSKNWCVKNGKEWRVGEGGLVNGISGHNLFK